MSKTVLSNLKDKNDLRIILKEQIYIIKIERIISG